MMKNLRFSSMTRAGSRSRRRGHLQVESLEDRSLLSATPVLTYRNDLAMTGQNLTETTLNYANVNVNDFGKLYSVPVDGQIYSQPLFVPRVNVAGQTHDVVYVATQHDSVYAVDSTSGSVLWERSFVDPANGVTTVPAAETRTEDITPEIGITSTPAIDLATSTLFVVAKTKEIVAGQTHYVQRIHALNLADGSTKLGGPKVMADTIYDGAGYIYVSGPTVNGIGDGSVNGKVTYNALRQHQRPALTLVGNTLYVASASHGDSGPYHGWVLGYDAQTLQLTSAFNTSPNSGLGGIWMAGAALAVDPQGFLYFSTGNGPFGTQLNANGFPADGSYGNAFVKLAVDPTTTPTNQHKNGWGLKVVDYFVPYNQDHLLLTGEDLGSGGMLILPDEVGSPQHPRLMISAGKEGKIYLLDRDNMGKFNPAGDQVVQAIPGVINGALSTPAYYDGAIYYVGGYGDQGKRFTIGNAQLSAPVSLTDDFFLFPGSSPSISANGRSDAIVWNLDRGTNQLRAYKAGDYSEQLWHSGQAPGLRDHLSGGVTKFSVPTVTAGKVFVGSLNSLVAYGLFQQATEPPAAPTDLVAQAVSSTQARVTWIDHATNEAGYRIEVSTDGIHYTVATTAPANTDDFFVGNLSPLTTYTFRVQAFNVVGPSVYSNPSQTTTSSGSAPGGIDFSLGFAASGPILQNNGSATIAGNLLQLTNSQVHQRGSAFTLDRYDVRKFTTEFAFQILYGSGASADGFTFTIQGAGPNALGPSGGGLGYGRPSVEDPPGIPESAAIKFDVSWNAGEGDNSTGLYLNGAAPTVPFVDLTNSPINLRSQHVMIATLTYDGAILSVQIRDTVTGGLVNHTYNVDLPAIVGAQDAYFGFTGGTGGDVATQNILAWTYAPLTQPFAPTQLTAVGSPNKVDITWQPVDDAQTYNVYRASSTNSQGATPYMIGLTSTQFTDANLGNNQTYFYKVTAVNALGESARSNEAVATTPAFPPKPTGQLATGIQTTRLTLRWTLNSTNETGILIRRKEGSAGLFNVVADLPPGTTIFADSNLQPGTDYDYHIIAYNDLGVSDFAGVFVRTQSAAPTTLTGQRVGNQNRLDWFPSIGATSYAVFRAETSFGIEEDSDPYVSGLVDTHFVDSAIQSGQTFYYRVAAQNAAGVGPVSSQVVIPGIPWRLQPNPLDPTKTDFFYDGSTGADQVRFETTSLGNIHIVETLFNGAASSLDTVVSGITGDIILEGNAGNDVFDASLVAVPVTIFGGIGNDIIYGGTGDDTLFGEYAASSGAPLTKAAVGADSILGGAGNDVIYGDGDGGEGAADSLDGGAGNDIIVGDGAEGGLAAADTIHGGTGDDTLIGESDGAEGAPDFITGDDGDDIIRTGAGNDTAQGGAGNDILLGGGSKGGANDSLDGGDGRDILVGDLGFVTTINDDGGKDTLRGGIGEDILLAGVYSVNDPINALVAIRAEWTSSRSYTERVANITGTGQGPRDNGNSLLNLGGNTFNDRKGNSVGSLADQVFGDADQDWFVIDLNEDLAVDLAVDENVSNLELFYRN